MGAHVFRIVGAVMTVAGVIWIITRLPSHPGDGPIGLAVGGLAAGGIAHVFVVGRRIVETSVNGIAALAKRNFAATHVFLGRRNDVLIACDAKQRVALCDIGRSGTVLTIRIVAPDELTVEAREDERPLIEAKSAGDGVTGKGSLVLRVTYRKRDYDVVFCDAIPRPAEGGPNWNEYEKMRGVVAWWRDTLSGRTPTIPYRFSSQLSLHASGPAVDAAYQAAIGGTLPEARIVKRT